MFFRRPVFIMLASLAAAAVFAIPRPDHPTGAAATVPDLLTPYERNVLQLEIVRLQREIATARRETAALPEFDGLRAAAAAAKAEGDGKKIFETTKALADAVETKLYENPEIPGKIKRLKEVGQLLEYDTVRRKEQRANGGCG